MLSMLYNNNKIALVDCNSFYVSCERLFNPAINKKPVVVLQAMMVASYLDRQKQKS